MRSLLAASLICAIACAPDIGFDEGEGVAPVVEFDPGNRIIPFPNNLLLDPMTGRVNLPEQCNESVAQTALRELVLNQLNGFGTFKTAIVVTLSEAVNPDSLEGRVRMFKRADAGTPIDPASAVEVPLAFIPTQSARSSLDCSETTLVPALAIVPRIPLDQNGTYTVVLTSGITGESGDAFVTSPTWALVRLEENPVTVDENGQIVAEVTPFDPVTDAATLLGIDLLFKAHAGALDFLDFVIEEPRSNILLAWDFNTQTTRTPLDAAIPDTPANTVPGLPLSGVVSLPTLLAGGNTQAFLQGALPGLCDSDTPPGPLPCSQVDDVFQADLTINDYQTRTTNPLDPQKPIKGPWSNPVTPSVVGDQDAITATVFKPLNPGAGPYPTVIFGHGLTRSRDDLFAIGSQFAAAGIMTVAIDWVAHGSRAVPISNAGACATADDPTVNPECFQPIISPDLGTTRDSIRQSALDILALVEALKACEDGGPSGECGEIDVDPLSIGYIGQSLGGIIGATAVAMGADIRTAVINVGAVGLLDVVENTQTLGIKCPLVDALIDAGVVVGDKLDATAGTGICTTDEWKTQPGYLQFAGIARWVLDPADGANYLARWTDAAGNPRPIFMQRVIDDAVVPNVATGQMGLLRGLTPAAADMTVDGSTPSAVINTADDVPLWVDYTNLPEAGAFPGNSFAHGSLLQPPSGSGVAGQLGTGLMQADAIGYLILNL